MMTMIAVIFVCCYAMIALEHPIKINKSATALIAAGLMWTLYSFASPQGVHAVVDQLTEKLAETAAIVFFLISAMTIVEVTDSHGGFEVITSRIKATKLSTLLWIIGFITFFLSSILDNMTTTIVMVALMKRLLKHHNQRLFFAGIIVIAANAGGAWSPIGDVTTTMLWIGGQVTTTNIMKTTFLASMASMVTPLIIASFMIRGNIVAPDRVDRGGGPDTTQLEKTIMFFMGMGSLIFVPIFKTVTHLPPYLGILLALGVLWLVGDMLHRNKTTQEKERFTLSKALKRIDMASVVFFIGILLAVATLSANGMLPALAQWLDVKVGNQSLIVVIIGLVSAIVDNIPLVAASMGMYPLAQFPPDSFIWAFMAYCAGTGGSILIIGSAAGVAAMGLEKIEFFWYARRIAPLALVGYFTGIAMYIFQYRLMH
jgi:Na+/H+ antiporter NhaD/arsenite permease-like protein